VAKDVEICSFSITIIIGCYTMQVLPHKLRYGDLTVFKMTAIRHLGFFKLENLTAFTVKRGNVRRLPNLMAIGRTVAELWRVFDFSKWRVTPSGICYTLV